MPRPVCKGLPADRDLQAHSHWEMVNHLDPRRWPGLKNIGNGGAGQQTRRNTDKAQAMTRAMRGRTSTSRKRDRR